jgi:hypothetical protein
MNINDHDNEKRLDEYIDALNAGRPAPQVAHDAGLADLFATARDLHRLRAAEPARDDVPNRLAAALERELGSNPMHGTRRIESNDMNLFRDASSIGSLSPPDDTGNTYAIPQRPERARQWAQFAVAAVAFILVGVVLTQIFGGGSDEPSSAVGTDPGSTSTIEVATSEEAGPTHAILTPTVTVPAIAPTPDESGVITIATFDEARELTQFELVEPSSLPPSMELAGVELFTQVLHPATRGATNDVAVDLVNAYYRYGASGAVVNFIQTIRSCSDTSTETVAYDDIEVGGKTVRRGLGTDANGQRLASYRWQSDGICLNLFAPLLDGVDEELLASFVSSIPTPEETATPEVEGTPPIDGLQPTTEPVSDESRPVLTLTVDYVTCDDIVKAYGEDFEPGTTIAIYFGGLVGDDFAPMNEEWLVHEDGTFTFVLDHGRFIGECNGGSPERDGNQYKIVAQTGSILTKDGVQTEGPSATAVLTFTRTVPAIVKYRERLPSCGTEIQRNESQSGPDQAARACFNEAVERDGRAEFVSHRETIEGDMITYVYRSHQDGSVEVFVDSTRVRFGSPAWTVTTCTDASLAGEADGLEIVLAGCDASSPIT